LTAYELARVKRDPICRNKRSLIAVCSFINYFIPGSIIAKSSATTWLQLHLNFPLLLMLFDNILEWRRVKEMDGLLRAGAMPALVVFSSWQDRLVRQ
jgi:hypothetical protein